jgi:hypothetical protein
MAATTNKGAKKYEDLLDVLLDKRYIDALVAALSSSLDEKLAARMADMNSAIIALKDDNVDLRARLVTAEKRIDELDQTSKLDSLMITGIKEGSYSERASPGGTRMMGGGGGPADGHAAVENTVIKFCDEHLKVALSPHDITAAYRLKAKTTGAIRPIVVRFANMKARDAVYRARRELKGANLDVYLSEHLTKTNSELYFEARMRLKARKIAMTWTQGGLVNIKFTKDPGEKPKIVRCLADLPN